MYFISNKLSIQVVVVVVRSLIWFNAKCHWSPSPVLTGMHAWLLMVKTLLCLAQCSSYKYSTLGNIIRKWISLIEKLQNSSNSQIIVQRISIKVVFNFSWWNKWMNRSDSIRVLEVAWALQLVPSLQGVTWILTLSLHYQFQTSVPIMLQKYF